MKKFFAVAIVATMAMPLFAADGATIFRTKGCTGCHGADGTKSMPAMGVKPLNSPEIKGASEARLIASVTHGKGRMPAYGSRLSPDEIKAVVAFVRTLK